MAVAISSLIGAVGLGPTAAGAVPEPSASSESPGPESPGAESPGAESPGPEPDVSESPAPAPPGPETDLSAAAPLAAASVTIPAVSRLAGPDRYATAVAASRAVFVSGSESVVIASGLAPPDAVTGAALAGAVGAPLLYVDPRRVPAVVAEELRRLAPSRIMVMGSALAVSDAVVATLATFAGEVVRRAGPDRYATSRAALADWPIPTTRAYLSDGRELLDAYPASATAVRDGAAMVLVNGGLAEADAETVAQLRATGITQIVAVAGVMRVSEGFLESLRRHGFDATRVSGADRYETSIALARVATPQPGRAFIPNSTSPPDSAVASSLASVTGQVMLYARLECMPDPVQAYLTASGLAWSVIGSELVLEAPVAANTSCSAHKATRQQQLLSAVQSALAQYPATYSVTVRQIGGLGETVSVNGATRREPASMIKLFAAYVALKKVEQGAISMTTRLAGGVNLRDCLKIMLYISDNFCHLDVVKRFGWQEVNRMITAAGFRSTTYGRVESTVLYAGNRSTTDDLSLFLQRLTAGQLLNSTNTNLILGHLSTQVWKERLPEGIPSGVTHRNKTGALWLAAGLMKGDTIIVYGRKATYAVSMMAFSGVDNAAFRAVSRAVYTHFNGSFGAARNYPIQILTTTKQTTLRSSPGGAIRVTVNAGTNLEPWDAQRTWYQVVYRGVKYWVAWNAVKTR